jgi:hypothetical protein
MSIETEFPATIMEKVDAAANYVEQMYLAHKLKDEKRFEDCHKEAAELLFDAIKLLDEEGF